MHRGFFRGVDFKNRADKHIPILATPDKILMLRLQFTNDNKYNVKVFYMQPSSELLSLSADDASPYAIRWYVIFYISWKEIISLFNAKSWDGLSKGFWLIGLACSSFSRKKTKTVYMEKIKLLSFTESNFWTDFKYSIKYHSDLLESIIQKFWYYVLKSVKSKAWRCYYLIPYCLLITNTWIRSLDRLVKKLVEGLIIKRKLI